MAAAPEVGFMLIVTLLLFKAILAVDLFSHLGSNVADLVLNDLPYFIL